MSASRVANQWFAEHQALLADADSACRTRSAFTPFIESPKAELHKPGADAQAESQFRSLLGKQLHGTFTAGHAGSSESVAARETSPYSLDNLGVSYDQPSVDDAVPLMMQASDKWEAATVEERLGVCLEAIKRLADDTFLNAYATMHTTGQAFPMAFAGSGANSLDRGLEALVYAHRAMQDVPTEAVFERSFGGPAVRLNKRYRLRRRGLAVVITCGSYPAWNLYPALFASLATGNPVAVKPHPGTILPVALAVRTIRTVLDEAGYDPNLVALFPDTPSDPITYQLVEHPATAIIDFTGSPQFGAALTQIPNRLVYTETAGTNTVVLAGANDLGRTLRALSVGLALFSGQMCTTPQNIYVPPVVQTANGDVSRDEVWAELTTALDGLLAKPSRAANLCGALQSPATAERVDEYMAKAADANVLLRPATSVAIPDFPTARTRTPTIIESTPQDPAVQQEVFGPIAYWIPVDSPQAALQAATNSVRQNGSIANYLYATDESLITAAEDAYFAAGSSIGINLVGQNPINYTAAFSDYHVTGLNPAGNACLTDLAFVTDRFRIVQSKREV